MGSKVLAVDTPVASRVLPAAASSSQTSASFSHPRHLQSQGQGLHPAETQGDDRSFGDSYAEQYFDTQARAQLAALGTSTISREAQEQQSLHPAETQGDDRSFGDSWANGYLGTQGTREMEALREARREAEDERGEGRGGGGAQGVSSKVLVESTPEENKEEEEQEEIDEIDDDSYVDRDRVGAGAPGGEASAELQEGEDDRSRGRMGGGLESHKGASVGGKNARSVEDNRDDEEEDEDITTYTTQNDNHDRSADMEFTRVISQPAPLDSTSTSNSNDNYNDSAAPNLSPESQKENPKPSRSPSHSVVASASSSPTKPFALKSRATNVHLEETAPSTAAPSSSGAVADILIHNRSSPSKSATKAFHSLVQPPSSSAAETEPASNPDEDLTRSALFSPVRAAREKGKTKELESSGGTAEGDVSKVKSWPDVSVRSGGIDTSGSGPETSTPLFPNAPPPAPLTAAKTYPALTFLETSTLPPSDLPPPSKPPTSVSAKFIYQSVAAFKEFKPKPEKKKSDSWGSDEEDSLEQEKEGENEKGEDEEDMSMDFGAEGQDSRASTPRPTAPSTAVDSGDVEQPQDESLANSISASASDSDSQSQSQSQSQIRDQRESKNTLMEISDLRSSFEQPTQITVEATQVEYDVDRYNDGGDTSEDRSLPRFAYETTDTTSTSRHSAPLKGRELRRKSPPKSSAPIPLAPSGEVEETQPETIPATQHEESMPESSPYVPLQYAHSSPKAVAATSSSVSRRASPPMSSTSAPAPSIQASASTGEPAAGISYNSVVPDSESPTQPAEERAAATRNDASTSTNAVEEDDEQDEASAMDVDGGVDVDVAKRYSSPEVVRPSKGKGKKNVVGGTATKGRAPGKQAVPTRVKGKGKAREVSPVDEEESLDDLDLLNDHQDPSKGLAMESLDETNYEDLPTANNARRRSSGRQATAPPLPPPAPASRKGKRKAEEAQEVSAPKKRRKSVPPPPPPSPPKKKGGRPRKNAARASLSGDESDAPVAGPSRGVRFASNEPMRRNSSRASTEASDIKPATKGKPQLPASAPFTRVFAIWRSDAFIYPGTVTRVLRDGLDVTFDDESTAKLKWEEVRRCELLRGDYVRYRGGEVETETQAETLSQDMRVMRVEKGETGEDTTGELASKDIAVVTERDVALADQASARKERLVVEALCIQPQYGAQFNNRKLTADDKARFRGLEQKPLGLLPVPAPDVAPAVDINPKKNAIFSGMGFLVTKAPTTSPSPSEGNGDHSPRKKPPVKKDPDEGKATLLRLIEDNGGTVLDLRQLFNVTTEESGDLGVNFPIAAFHGLDTLLLLTDRPCTTPKWLVALALGIPCISSEFIGQSIAESTRLDWRLFNVPAGYLNEFESYTLGSQAKVLCRDGFDMPSLKDAWNFGGVFKGRSLLFTLAKKGKKTHESNTQITTLRALLAAAGARKVDFIAKAEDAAGAEWYDYVILEEGHSSTKALGQHPGVRRLDWVKQCLIAGRLLA
ncbi:BRCT domain containing protein [Pseudohyphozyma bogoriensis]|nr:BRCT domain containing protein [Pseudohyphozyma bogoriensis]